MSIKEEFEIVCNNYVDELCKLWGFNRKESYWIAGRIGEVVYINSYPITFDNVRYAVDNKVPIREYQDWEEYTLMVIDINNILIDKLDIPNFEHWCKGCPRISFENLRLLAKTSSLIDTYINYKS